MKISKIINANILDILDNKTYLATLYLKEGYIDQIISQDSIVNHNEALDLEQKWITPGFIDTHSHPTVYGRTKTMVDCSANKISNIEGLIQQFKVEKENLYKKRLGYGLRL